MSVVVRLPDGGIKLYCKGADTRVFQVLASDNDQHLLEVREKRRGERRNRERVRREERHSRGRQRRQRSEERKREEREYMPSSTHRPLTCCSVLFSSDR